MASPFDEQVVDTVYPWDTSLLDAQRYTGGDWYKLLLTASLGNKALHGANTSPTCEVLTKVTSERFTEDNVGRLIWDPEPTFRSSAGSGVADQCYKHHNYLGSVTLSGSALAYDIGVWEPGARKRARSTALLAAGMHSHGVPREDATFIVGKIAGEEIDDEAVESALIPASHLKREMTVVSKTNHRVFGRGTIQRGIIWQDQNLVTDPRYAHVAFDWGRITAIARYIAEANVQNCGSFRAAATQGGIPYVIVRNCYAYVAASDYRLSVEAFSKVPELDCTAYCIPSLRGLFEGHETDVMTALGRDAERFKDLVENDSFTGYLEVMRDAKRRRGAKERVRVESVSQAKVNVPMEHLISADDASDLLKGANAARNALITAIASKRSFDTQFDQILVKVSSLSPGNIHHFEQIDDASKLIYQQQIWSMAFRIAEDSIVLQPSEGSPVKERAVNNIRSKLARLKKEIYGYTIHLNNQAAMPNSVLAELRPRTIRYAIESANLSPNILFSQRTLVSSQLRTTMSAMNRIEQQCSPQLLQVNHEISAIYENWMNDALADTCEAIRLEGCIYAFHYFALRSLTPAMCMAKVNGYIDGAAPNRSYIAMALSALSDLFPHPEVLIKRHTYINAVQLAEEVDLENELPYSVSHSVRRTTEILDQVLGDLLIGRVWQPDLEEYTRMTIRLGPPLSPQYDTSMMEEAEELEAGLALLRSLNEDREVINQDTYEACLNSYPSERVGTELAVAMGYNSLRDAHNHLGLRCYYFEDSPYIIEAQGKLQRIRLQGPASSDSSDGSFVNVL